MVWVTNMHQHIVPLTCLSGKKCCDRRTLFMYVCHVRPSQQDSCETVPPKSTLSELNLWFYGAVGKSCGYM